MYKTKNNLEVYINNLRHVSFYSLVICVMSTLVVYDASVSNIRVKRKPKTGTIIYYIILCVMCTVRDNFKLLKKSQKF